MDSKEIDLAMKHRLPVVCDGIRYECIHEYVSWYDKNGNRHLSCGLITRNGIIRVSADRVKLAEGSNNGDL